MDLSAGRFQKPWSGTTARHETPEPMKFGSGAFFVLPHIWKSVILTLNTRRAILPHRKEGRKMDYPRIGQQIRTARIKRKMTQAQLAEAADLSVPYISHVERGKKRISLDALLRISQALGVTVDQLLSGAQPQDKSAYLPEIEELFGDCTLRERRILRDIVAAVKNGLREIEKKGG